MITLGEKSMFTSRWSGCLRRKSITLGSDSCDNMQFHSITFLIPHVTIYMKMTVFALV